MENLDNLVKNFLAEESFTMNQALGYSALGLGETSGKLTEVVNGILFAGQEYSDERKTIVGENIGKAMFYLYVLAQTTDIPITTVIEHYIASFEAIKGQVTRDKRITLQDLMDMQKYVKYDALREIEREEDNEKKRNWREKAL